MRADGPFSGSSLVCGQCGSGQVNGPFFRRGIEGSQRLQSTGSIKLGVTDSAEVRWRENRKTQGEAQMDASASDATRNRSGYQQPVVANRVCRHTSGRSFGAAALFDRQATPSR